MSDEIKDFRELLKRFEKERSRQKTIDIVARVFFHVLVVPTVLWGLYFALRNHVQFYLPELDWGAWLLISLLYRWVK